MPEWKKIEDDVGKFCLKLKSSVISFQHEQNDPVKCDDCLLRMIALLWLQSKFKISFIDNQEGTFWNVEKIAKNNIIRSKQHGGGWHNMKLETVESYFTANNLATMREPALLYGRADLAVPALKSYFEVGTTGLYKLYYNLLYMHDCKIIIIPNDFELIEFVL